MIKRLKELASGYKASSGVYGATKIFSDDEIEDVFQNLPKLLAVVEAGDRLASYLDQFIQTAKVPEVRYEDALQLLITWDAARKALG